MTYDSMEDIKYVIKVIHINIYHFENMVGHFINITHIFDDITGHRKLGYSLFFSILNTFKSNYFFTMFTGQLNRGAIFEPT